MSEAGLGNSIAGRFVAVYRIAASFDEAQGRARDIAYEQTVELPPELVPESVAKSEIPGRVEAVEAAGQSLFRARISYPESSAGGDLLQFLNVVFGNSSIKPGIAVESVELSPEFAQRLSRGPRFGVQGLRKLLSVPKRPLTCTALKPMGLSSSELADMAYRCALGGIDLIKDDHGLTNQVFSPFDERLELCTAAVARANGQTGGNSRYVPNLTGPIETLAERARKAREAGAGAVMISLGLAGFDALRLLAQVSDLPVVVHPAFSGSFVQSPTAGIAHGLLYGTLVRLAGADLSIFPNFRGRFSFSPDECRDIARACREPFAGLEAIFPAPAGGMGLERVGDLVAAYGLDFVGLIGGGLQKAGPDLTGNCRLFVALMEDAAALEGPKAGEGTGQ